MPRSRESDPHTLVPSEQSVPADYARVAQEYDTYLSGFVAGDHGCVELGAGEQRPVVRDQLQAAARRRDLALRFRPGRGPLIFYVEAAPALLTERQPARPVAPAEPTARPPAPAKPAVQRPSAQAAPPEPHRSSSAARERPARPQQRPRGSRQPAAGRYDDLLPRWMREGQQAGQRRNPRPKRRRP